jgi:hypothetical protein
LARTFLRAIALAAECALGNPGRMQSQVIVVPSSKVFLISLALFTAAGVLAGGVYRLVNWGYDVLGCTLHREPGTFLAYCQSKQYGDFEHGAYYFDLEPEAVENLRKAKVLFLGNSKTQFGFSTDKVKGYFNERSIPFYVMGFGYGEGVDFARTLIKKYNLKPKVLIVVSDPFFKSGLAPPASAIFDNFNPFWKRLWPWWDSVTKKIFNTLQPKICDLRAALCRSHSRTIYRVAKDGSWIWRNLFRPPEYGQFPLDPARRKPLTKEPAMTDQENARYLFEAAGVRRDCVVLTVVPNSDIDAEPYAVESGRLLGVRVELPKLDGLVTIDHLHLTWNSAQRWSGTFLREVDPLIARCVSEDSSAEKAQSGSVVVTPRYANRS